jgi:hypothetical protein
MLMGKRNLRGLGDDSNATYVPLDNTPLVSSDITNYTGATPTVPITTQLLNVGNEPAPSVAYNEQAPGNVQITDQSAAPVTPATNTFSSLVGSIASVIPALVKANQPQTSITNPVASPIYTYGTGGVAQNATLTSPASNTMLYVSLGIAAVLVLLALRK